MMITPMHGQIYKKRIVYPVTTGPVAIGNGTEHNGDIQIMLDVNVRWTLVSSTTTCVLDPGIYVKVETEQGHVPAVFYTTFLTFERDMTQNEMDEYDREWEAAKG